MQTQSAITGCIILYTQNITYLCQSFLDKLVEDAVLLANVMPHHRLPVRIVLPVAAGHWANVPKNSVISLITHLLWNTYGFFVGKSAAILSLK